MLGSQLILEIWIVEFSFVLIFQQVTAIRTISSSCAIPGSTLRAGVQYHVDMKDFRPGFLTWTTTDVEQDEIRWLLHHEFSLEKNISSKCEIEALWEFYPSKKYPGWYKMRNGGFPPDSYVTWSRIDYVPTQRENTSHYLVLEKYRKEEDFLIKPVFADTDGTIEYHQLVMRQIPHGKINWSRHNKNGHFIQNHHGDFKKDRMDRYEKEGPDFSDTLFFFTEAKKTYDWECLARSGQESGKFCKLSGLAMMIPLYWSILNLMVWLF